VKTAAIVGCGNIAGLLDSSEDEHIITHAHAYQKYPQTKLIAVCDPDTKKREDFVTSWGTDIQTYSNLTELLAHEKIDILSICSPTPFHAQALKEAFNDRHISTIICEKPFVQTQEEIDEIKTLVNTSDKKMIINFIRRYDPSIQELKKLLDSKELGEILHFNANFTKGLYHNGSHMLELIEYLCGSIHSIKANTITHADDDLYGTFYLDTLSSHGTLHNESGESYALFELELVLSKGRVQIKDSGHSIIVETVKPSTQYPGYFRLAHEKTLPNSLNNYLYNTLEYCLSSTDHSETLDKHITLSQKLLTIKDHLYEKHFLEFT